MELLEGRVEIDDLDAFVARLGAIGDEYGVAVQAFDARYVAGERHLERAAELADRSIARGENVARDRAVEILLYAAGRRQIDRALEMGVSEGENRVVVLVDGGDGEGDEAGAIEELRSLVDGEESSGARRTTSELRFDGDEDVLCDFFEITDAERAATDATVLDLVCERVALLEVEK